MGKVTDEARLLGRIQELETTVALLLADRSDVIRALGPYVRSEDGAVGRAKEAGELLRSAGFLRGALAGDVTTL